MKETDPEHREKVVSITCSGNLVKCAPEQLRYSSGWARQFWEHGISTKVVEDPQRFGWMTSQRAVSRLADSSAA